MYCQVTKLFVTKMLVTKLLVTNDPPIDFLQICCNF